MSDQLDPDKMVRTFQKIKAKREQLKREFAAADEELKSKQALLQSMLLKFLTDSNLSSARTSTGTIYKQTKILPRAADWDVFYTWVRENDAFDFLEKRITRDAVKRYMEENDGLPPPGVSIFSEIEVGIRKNG